MNRIKHSKYKNTGILFELLIRQITADTLEGKESPIKEILKKYFVKTELGKEYKLYESLLKDGIAKECARFVLPLATPTRIYMSGNCRNWIHYIQLRSANGTQKEHMDIANECKNIFIKQFPIVSEALGWENV